MIKERNKGGLMKLTTPFTSLGNTTSDIWKSMILTINYQKIKDKIFGKKNVWSTQQVCIEKFTN